MTLALSGIAILFTFSVRYRPVPAAELTRGTMENLTFLLQLLRESGSENVSFAIENFQQTNSATDPWLGDYRFTLVINLSRNLDEEAVHQVSWPTPSEIENILKQSSSWMDQVQVAAETSDDPYQERYLVRTTGTKVEDYIHWIYEPRLFFGAVPLSFLKAPMSIIIYILADQIIAAFGAAVTMFLSTIITAFFIPNMLRKGSVELLLAKPIHRSTLLLYKFIGGLSFMFINTVVIVVGIWLALGCQTGVWLNGFLLCIFIFTFQFAIFYAVSTVTAVMTRSSIVAILMAIVTWVMLFGIGVAYRFLDTIRPESRNAEVVLAQTPDIPKWVFTTADIIHLLAPHYKDLDVLTTELILKDLMKPGSAERKQLDNAVGSINWPETLISTTLFIVILVGFSCWWFATRDY
ncbi:MAG: ABC transporter permease [Gemmataceae bacterium]